MKLKDIQKNFTNYILEKEGLEIPVFEKQNMGIYQKNYVDNVGQALASSFEKTCALLGDESKTFIKNFLLDNPPEDSNLNLYGKNFPEFLKDLSEEIFETATVEWAIQDLYNHGLRRPLGLKNFQELSESDLLAKKLIKTPYSRVLFFKNSLVVVLLCKEGPKVEQIAEYKEVVSYIKKNLPVSIETFIQEFKEKSTPAILYFYQLGLIDIL